MRECCRQAQVEVLSNSRVKIHHTLGHPFAEPCTYMCNEMNVLERVEAREETLKEIWDMRY